MYVCTCSLFVHDEWKMNEERGRLKHKKKGKLDCKRKKWAEKTRECAMKRKTCLCVKCVKRQRKSVCLCQGWFLFF